MRVFKKLPKLQKGDKVAILSPSFAAPGVWKEVYHLGLARLRDVFGLEAVEYPTTAKVGASGEERSKDLIAAFSNKEIKAVISTLGGDDEVMYVKHLDSTPFRDNPKPFFGYSDTTHLQNFLWLNNIPSYYGGSLFNQFAMQGQMNEMTVKYLQAALFSNKIMEIERSEEFNDEGLSWSDLDNLTKRRKYEPNSNWYWDGNLDTEGVLWGGCLESIDELLRHNIIIPSKEEFANIILVIETSEEIPSPVYVKRVLRAMGERGLLSKLKGVLVGRPKAWEFDKPNTREEKEIYKKEQRQVVTEVIRQYNSSCPIIQNLDFGHTDPQICLPLGHTLTIDSSNKVLNVWF